MKIKDRFWLWGHPEGRYNMERGIVSRMTPMEGCSYFGVNNVFMSPAGWKVDRDQYNKSFRRLNNVAWEIDATGFGTDAADQLIAEAKEYPNITACVLDDFHSVCKYSDPSADVILKFRERLRNNDVRPLDMWMSLYTHEFGMEPSMDAQIQKYMEPFDGVIMWTWNVSRVPYIPQRWELFKTMTEGKKRLIGCVLWDFGYGTMSKRDFAMWQLNWAKKKIMDGEAEGVVLHTNVMADTGDDTYKAALEWMDAHGEEDI